MKIERKGLRVGVGAEGAAGGATRVESGVSDAARSSCELSCRVAGEELFKRRGIGSAHQSGPSALTIGQ